MNYETPADSMMDEVEPQGIDENSAEVQFASENLAENLSEDDLTALGEFCRRGFEVDLQSRSEWDECLQDYIDLAKQYKENKTYPWPGASNVKYPLLSTAAMQFAARAYPSLVPSNGLIVKSVVIGKDPTGEKLAKADRVAEYMSYQVMHDIEGWEEDMDKMLMQLPVVGMMFKKTWFDSTEDRVDSRLIQPRDIVVNYWTRCLQSTERISEIILMSPRVLKEKQNAGLFLDVDLGTPRRPEEGPGDEFYQTGDDETTPYTLVEQHMFYDNDNDDYAEPYIVTFERWSGKVLSMIRRYKLDDVTEKDGKVIKIKPIQMYTKFGFVPNPDGSFYDIGFGVLLGPLNESVNTLINQLVDSGTLHNLQSGFLSKTLRARMGDQPFAPGEWRPVNATGDDLRKQIIPLPTKEPSTVLFQLMGTLITSGKELASVAEIFTGKMPGQNTPATTTMATVEQGMKVFTAVYKRIFRSLQEEFYKIFDLNKTYLDPNKYVAVIDAAVGPDDFDLESYDICPGADPTAMSQSEKLQKAMGLMELVQMAPQAFDIIEVLSRVLEAQEQPNWQKVFNQEVQQSGQLPPPPPDPKVMAIQAKAEADAKETQMNLAAKQQEMELDGRDKQMQMVMEQQNHAQKMSHEIEMTQVKAASEKAMSNVYLASAAQKATQDGQHKEQAHQQKMTQQKELAKSKPSPKKTTGSGSTTR